MKKDNNSHEILKKLPKRIFVTVDVISFLVVIPLVGVVMHYQLGLQEEQLKLYAIGERGERRSLHFKKL